MLSLNWNQLIVLLTEYESRRWISLFNGTQKFNLKFINFVSALNLVLARYGGLLTPEGSQVGQRSSRRRTVDRQAEDCFVFPPKLPTVEPTRPRLAPKRPPFSRPDPPLGPDTCTSAVDKCPAAVGPTE